MSINEVAQVKRLTLNKIMLYLLSVAFLFLSFLTKFQEWVLFLVSLTILGDLIYLNRKNLKNFDYLSLFILFIPIIGIGLMYAFGNFSSYYYSLVDRIFMPLNIISFVMSGVVLARGDKNLIKYIFVGLFTGLALICLINAITTIVKFGFFYTFNNAQQYMYYGGVISTTSIESIAYCLVGFRLMPVSVLTYLIYPCLLLLICLFYLFNPRRCKKNIIYCSSLLVVSLFSILVVISKFSFIVILPMILYIIVMMVLFIFPKLFNRPVTISFMVIGGLLAVFSLLFFLNSQSTNTAIKAFTSSNSFLNLLFNNRLARPIYLVLDGLFLKEKLFGFPILYDEIAEAQVMPCTNFAANQFMYMGIIGVMFLLLLFILFVYSFVSLRKNKKLDFMNKCMPFLFIVGTMVIFSFMDSGNLSIYGFIPNISATNPFFLFTLMLIGLQYTHSLGGTNNEK